MEGRERVNSDEIRVLLADDHALFRQGLQEIVDQADDLTVVGEAPDGASAVRLARELEPDVVLMDLHMPLMDGVDATNAVTKLSPSPAVILLTVSTTSKDVLDAIAAGAAGYVLKDASPEEIHNAVREARAGRSPLSPTIAGALLQRVREQREEDRAKPERLPSLTDRETQVLRMLALGRENNEIAAELFVSPATVKGDISALYEKLGVRSRVQAAVRAARAGLV